MLKKSQLSRVNKKKNLPMTAAKYKIIGNNLHEHVEPV